MRPFLDFPERLSPLHHTLLSLALIAGGAALALFITFGGQPHV